MSITDDDAARMYEAGWTQEQIAIRAGVDQSTVSAHLRAFYGDMWDEARLLHEAARDGTSGGLPASALRVQDEASVVWDMFRQGWPCSDIDALMHLSRGTAKGHVLGKWREQAERADRARLSYTEPDYDRA